MHPKYARLVRHPPEPQNNKIQRKKFFFLKPKFLRRALGIIILLVAVSWSFQQWIPWSKAYATPWSPTHGSYAQRKQLTLVNNSGQTFESGTTYKVTIDTASLYNTGSLLSTCDDLRIVYQPSDTTAIELKRNVEYASSSSGITTCATSSATKVVFQLQADMSNGSNTSYYYLYYDNPTATTYPAADALDAYNVGSKEATFVAPFNGTTTALAAGSGTPTTATGAIRYSGGKSALSFDGANDDSVTKSSLSISGLMTIEMWVNPSSSQSTTWPPVFTTSAGRLEFVMDAPNKFTWVPSDVYWIRDPTSRSANNWYHVAVIYDGTYWRMFVSGELVATSSPAGSPSLSYITLSDWGSRDYSGFIDEVRISSTVRYTSNFTPSTNPFVRDEYTKLLWHFDENGDDPRNTGKAIDDSGNGNHGTITGAKYVGGLVGVDGSTTSNSPSGYMSNQSYTSHDGVFIEEGTTNKITNPSFDHATYNTNWNATQTYTQEDQFTTVRAGGAVNGTSAEPTGGTRTAIDTNSKISITGGQLSFATGETANDGVWYPVQTRAAGKLLSATITPADTNGDILFGWDTDQTGAIADAIKFTASGVLQIVPNGGTAVTVGSYTATSYQVASVMRATGIYWFIKGGTYTTWTQLFSTSAGSANMYPAVQAGNTTAVFTIDNMRIPTATWLPTPLAYDTFTRANGALGSTEATGPDSQVIPQLAWTGSTWTVSGNTAKNTPSTLGNDVITNGMFDSDTAWNHTASWNISGGVATKTTGADQSLLTQTPYTANTWYKTTFDVTSGSVSFIYLGYTIRDGGSSSRILTFPVLSTDLGIGFRADTAGAVLDNVVAKPMTFTELISSVSVAKSDIVAKAYVPYENTRGNLSGLILRLDSSTTPQNYISVLLGGGASSQIYIYVDKCVSGSCSRVASSSNVSGQGDGSGNMVVSLNGSSVVVWYNSKQFINTTIADASIINNTLHGLLSSDSLNSLDSFSLFPLGNGGENVSIPVEPTEFLTATENSTAPYYKFGSKSVKLVDATNATQYATSINPGNTNTHTLSAYVYDGTTGNIGGTVSSSIAKLVFNGSVVTPAAYTDVGGGWWRLTYSAAAANATATYGVEVQAGKTIYVDGVQLEEKAYATTYTDGTMGTGYAWTGTANDSTSTRDFAKTAYQTGNLPDNTKGSISFWVKPLGNRNTIVGCYDNNYIGLTSGGNMGVYIQTKGNLTGLKFTGRNNGGTWFDSSPTNGTLTEGVWSHLVLTWDASSAVLYKNGSSYSTYSGALPTTFSNPILYAGYAGDTCPSTGIVNIPSNSSISGVNVYSDSLSSTAVQDLYYSGLGSHSSLAPVATERYTDGEPPVLAWHLNEGYGTTAYDTTIYGNSGTISGASFSPDSPISSQFSLKFDGTNDYVSRAYTNDTELAPGTSPFSVSTWFKHPSTVSGTDTLISRYSSTGSGGGYKVYMNSSGYICFGVDDDTTWGPDDSACTTVSYADSNWHHVLAIKGTSTIAVYIDGTQKASTTFTVSSSLSGSSPTFYTGIDSDGTSNPWDGFIDEVRVYNSSRSEEQINQEYIAKGTNKGVSAQFGSGGASDTLTKGLVGHWKMDEASWNGTAGEVLDASGNGNNGTSVNGATTASGKYGNGGSFDGGDDYILASTTTLTNNFSYAAWINVPASWIKNYPTVISINNVADLLSRHSDVSNKAHFQIYSGSTWYSANSTAALSQGWHHVVGVLNTSQSKVFLYVDGVLQGTSMGPSSFSSTSIVNIGKLPSNSGSYFNGSLDDVRIYNRALSPAEVRALYEYAPGPVAHYTFDEGSGQSANDKSGNGNTGTLGASSSVGSDDPTWVAGKYGKGLSFDGGDYVGFGSSLNPYFVKSKAFTINAWIKTSDSNGQSIVTNADWSDPYVGMEFRVNSTGTLKFDLNQSGSNLLRKTTTSTVNSGTWRYVSLIYSGSGAASGATLLIDGITASATTDYDTLISDVVSSTNLQIGARDGVNTPYSGAIDDVRIYNYARTQKQIIQDMNAGHPAVGSPVGSAIAHYKFDEGQGTVARNSGNGGSTLNGTLTNMSSPATSTSGWTNDGKFGKALVFDGGNDYVRVNDNSSLDFGSGDFTVSSWAKKNNAPSSWKNSVISKWSSGSSPGSNEWVLAYGYSPADSKLPGFAIESGSTIYTTISTEELTTGQWYHLVGMRKGSNITLYVNGVQKATTNIGSVTVNNVGRYLKISGIEDSIIPFDGSIDEVKIYNYALSEDEVKLEYNQGKAIVMGNIGTTTDGKTASNAQSRAYCPPGNVEGNCAAGLNPAPIAEWNFDEGSGTTATDTSGNNNTGTLTNGPTWANGKTGKGLSFDGTDDYVNVANESAFDITGAITVSAWIKIRAFTTPWQTIIAKDDTSWRLARNGTNNSLEWVINNSSGGLLFALTSGSAAITDGKWHHVVGYYDSSRARLYVDGLLVSQSTVSNTYNNNSSPVQIGANGGARKWLGSIDNVRVYNYARTPAQIAWDYNQGLPAVHYKFNECTGTTINNSVPNSNDEESGNNGTLTIGASGTQTSAGTCSSGVSTEAWNNGKSGAFNTGMSLDGTDDYVTTGDTNININSVSVWVRPSSTSQSIIDLDGGTHTITVSSGTISAGGFSSPTIYVDGKVSSTLPNTDWHMITVTTATAFEASNLVLGKISSNYFNGRLDEFKMFTYPLTREQVKLQYNDASAVKFKAEDTEKWWLAGGVDAASAVAVYQPKGAASLSASYSNLANPGTYDATPGVAPTWNATNGWDFANQAYLDTGVLIGNNYTVIARWYANALFTAYWPAVFGLSSDAYNGIGYIPSEGTRSLYSYGLNQVYVTPAPIPPIGAVSCISGTRAYENGIEKTSGLSGTTSSSLSLYIGAMHHSGSVDNWFGRRSTDHNYVSAFAIYNSTLTADQVAKITAKMQGL